MFSCGSSTSKHRAVRVRTSLPGTHPTCQTSEGADLILFGTYKNIFSIFLGSGFTYIHVYSVGSTSDPQRPENVTDSCEPVTWL